MNFFKFKDVLQNGQKNNFNIEEVKLSSERNNQSNTKIS